MNSIEIRRPAYEDMEALNSFFSLVIRDTFDNEGLGNLHDDINNEIEIKKNYLLSDLDSNGDKRYFLIALDKDRIVGSIEYGPSNHMISSITNGAFKDVVEIGTVFVHPNYQQRGIGNLLLNVMYLTLQNRGIEEFCLDSGYTNAQKIWKKKLGEPDYLIKDYWGEGYDHMIWRRNIKEISVTFKI